MQTRLLAVAAALALWTLPGTAASAHGAGNGHGGTLSLTLSGAQVPGGGDPDGRGRAALRLDPEHDVVCLRANWAGLDGDVTAIHLHRAPEGQTGPHHVDLLDDEHLAGQWNQVELCVQASGDRIEEMLDNPADFYMNVHSTAFPDGAIRGQLG